MWIQKGGSDRWSGPLPLKNSKNIGFLSNTDPDPLKNQKPAKPAFDVGPLSAIQLLVNHIQYNICMCMSGLNQYR